MTSVMLPASSIARRRQVAPLGDFRMMPWPGEPMRMLPPVTSSLDLGAVVPMPTLVSAVAKLTPLILPRTSELSCVTCAWAPIAVALLRLFEPTSASSPRIVFRAPVVFVVPA